MESLKWKLRRLSAMGPTEIAHRAQVALRDRLLPPRWSRLAPADAYGHLWQDRPEDALRSSRLAEWLDLPEHSSAFEFAVSEGKLLASGRWNVFGHAVTLGDPPRWIRNPLTGAEWPDVPSAKLDFRRADIAGGVKPTWELGRLTTLPTLALATRLTGQSIYAARAARWLDDWNARNPLGRGIHHTSGVEMAVRVLTVSATLAWLEDHGPRSDRVATLGLLAQQACWCRDHLSLGSSANNHLLAEYAAMTAAGALYPSLRDGARLLASGFAGLEREVLRQFHLAGVNGEQSFGYLPFIWEIVLLALTAAETAGLTVTAAVRDRLAASLEFARAIRLPDGRWPQIGDEDDGRVLLAGDGPSRLDLVGNALAAWLERPGLSNDAAALALITTGLAPSAAQPASDGVQDFDDDYRVWRHQGVLVTFDTGPLGLGALAAHGHADALAVTIFRGAEGLVVDPGTFAYQEDPAARDRCRSTPVHSTLHFEGRSQSEMLGAFLWGRRAKMRGLGPGACECRWWTGERHERRVEVDGGRVTLTDVADGPGAELAFALAPGASASFEGTRAIVTSGRSRAVFEGEGTEPWRVEPGEHAPRFGQRVPALRLCARLTGTRAVTRITTGAA